MRPEDFSSSAWDHLVDHINARIQKHQLMLERDQPEETTAILRGRIKELRELLKLPQTEWTTNQTP